MGPPVATRRAAPIAAVTLTFKIDGNKLEVWEGVRLIRTTTVNALADAAQAIQRGRTLVTL